MTAPGLPKLQQLSGFRSIGKDQWEARCPAHDDRKASLTITIGDDGRILVYCHAGCDLRRILETAAISEKDLFDDHGPQPSERRIVATYDYQTPEGELSYQVVRYQPKDFRQRRLDGKGGWIWDTKGLKRLPYNLPQLPKAEYLFVVEGEKDVEFLRKIGLVATCNSGGAGKWTADLAQYFRADHRVTVIPDNDEPGRKHARHVAASLQGKVASVKILELAGLPEHGDVSDWLVGRDPIEAAEELSRLAEAAPEWKPEQTKKSTHGWEQVEDRYKLTMPDIGVVLEVDRLRREDQQLIGELCVRCDLPGARSYQGTLSVADFNLSSARARTERAKLLADRSNAPDLDWSGLIEEFSQRVLTAERSGQPAIDLRETQKPAADDELRIEHFRFPRRHPTIIFGDGGSGKSYFALYLAGRLAQEGFIIGLFDWELADEDHRDRLERLFGLFMPPIWYVRCERPLVYECDRLRRIVRDHRIDYAIFDSVAVACDGPPESAETAGRYFRCVRQVTSSSLHIAHVKAEAGDQRPFGSVFWSNLARSTWYCKLVSESIEGDTLVIGLFHKKANLGRLHQPAGFQIGFDHHRTVFTAADPADVPDLAEKMSIRQRMIHILRGGGLPIEQVASELDADRETITRTVRRHKTTFTLLQGGQVALLQRLT